MKSKELVWNLIHEIPLKAKEMRSSLNTYYDKDAVWEIFHPFNTLKGTDAAFSAFWQPLMEAFPDLERRVDIFAGDTFKEESWVTVMGHLCGTFTHPWLGIPATGRVAYLRMGEFLKVRDGRIVKHHILLDIPEVMRQAGVYPFREMLGSPYAWFGPKLHNGIRPGETDHSAGTLETVLSMHKALHDFDGKNLDTMNHASCWSEDFLYYGAAGIGTTRGMEQFKVLHQQPFLKSFPDRHGTDHYVRISDGPVACTSHWGTLTATHLGSQWLGLPASGKKLTMRVADWYCADGMGKLKENWLHIDILHILDQLGYDPLENMRLSTSLVNTVQSGVQG